MTIPSHIGQYRILRKIGAGGMGMVFLGEHTLLGRRAAIKTLLPNVAANHEIVERFFNEARATSAISDPGVIQIFDFGYHVDGTAYIVMELLEGEALAARIGRLGKLSPADALRLARQITGSLAAAHACDIVHRDLKPENIFLVRDVEAQGGERTKILDFGICKVGTGTTDVAVTQVGAMVGTPVYMSPEQCRGAADVDHRSDIYAFGCLLFHMLTGRPPFVGESSGDLIVAHMQADPPTPSIYVADLPFAVDALVLRCLAKSADDRYQSMTELTLALGDIYAQLDSTEPTVATVPPAMPLGRGFRSVYDGNVAAFTGGSSRLSPAICRPRPQPRFVSTPTPTPSPDDGDVLDLPPRRHSRVRTVLAGALVASAIIGLMATWLTQDSDSDSHRAEASPPAPAPIEPTLEPRAPEARPPVPVVESDPEPPMPAMVVTSQPAPSTSHAASARASTAMPATAAATVERAPDPAPSGAPSQDRARSPRESPREVQPVASSPQRPAAPMPRPPSPPLEDLYDTR